MKLGELRGIIRKTKGNPSIKITMGNATSAMTLPLQKVPLLDALGEAFNNAGTAETGIEFDERTGLLIYQAALPLDLGQVHVATVVGEVDLDDEDSMLLDL